MRFSKFRGFNDRLKATTGIHEREHLIRLLMAECNDDAERVIAAQLLVGRLSSSQEGLTTGIKEAFVAKDLGLDGRQSLEDIGKVALERCEIGKHAYDVGDIWASFRSYIESAGRKHEDRSRIINHVMFDLAETKEDVPLMLEILCEKVSNGIKDTIILHALQGSDKAPATPKERASTNAAYSCNPDLAAWVWALHNRSDEDARRIMAGTPVADQPLEPQLCDRVKDLSVVLKAHNGETWVQPKLDGQRLHIHVWREPDNGLMMRRVKLFSRELKDFTDVYPEIALAFAKLPIEQHAILDGELVAITPAGDVAPFNLLQKRIGRKTDQAIVRVGVVLYDVLLMDDENVTGCPYIDRLGIVKTAVAAMKDPRIQVIETTKVTKIDDLRGMLMEAHEAGEEGLVCKDPGSLPEPGQRNRSWVKLKPDYMQETEFGDSFDLVVIGYNKGRGKRYGGVGALWAAIRDKDRPDVLWPVCKVGTGLKDEDLEWFAENLVPMQGTVDTDAAYRDTEMDILVEPKVVIEVKAAKMTKIEKWSGFSLLFPRMVRIRHDKSPKNATSTAEVQAP